VFVDAPLLGWRAQWFRAGAEGDATWMKMSGWLRCASEMDKITVSPETCET